MSKKVKPAKPIASTDRMEDLLAETERELERIQPQIEKLEKQLEKLSELKRTKQKLITLKLSIKSILSNFSESGSVNVVMPADFTETKEFSPAKVANKMSVVTKPDTYSTKTFLPDLAFEQVNTILKKTTSLNYELFRAVVFSGGRATTEQIKAYLVENDIRQPGSGQSFEQVELTDISARIHYLVRKDVVEPDGRGGFISKLGWMAE